ncbi:MAG TPA: hypothetical protein VFS33_07275 [Gemmatimonadales bacterium]|nr:hypothetical protein [Gemmatimonadales bacterium]
MQAAPDPTWQTLSWQAAVVAALVAALAAVVKGFWALGQQRRELRWKQAELARELVDKWFEWEASNNALRMVDEGLGSYTVDGYGTHQIDPQVDIPRALAVVGSRDDWQPASNTDADRMIRKCFDVLFYCLERVQHSVQIGVVKRDDVVVPAEYYVRQLARFYTPIAAYMDYVDFPRAKKFLCSFKAWSEVAKSHERLLALRARLNPAFAPDTAYPGASASSQPGAGSTGHCAAVAAIVQAEFGGRLLQTFVNGEEHWFNRVSIGDARFDIDLTGDQFGGPEVHVGPPGRLYPHSLERTINDLHAETLDRARRLAARAKLRKVARRLGRQQAGK